VLVAQRIGWRSKIRTRRPLGVSKRRIGAA